MKPNCLTCIYHRANPRSVHCQCVHPCVRYNQGEAMMDVIYYGQHRRDGFNIGFEPQAVVDGRVAFPTSYDHRYLAACSGHTLLKDQRIGFVERVADFLRFNF